MYNPSLKPVLAGIAIGLLIVAIPFFLIKAALVLLLVGALFRFVGRRMYWHRRMRADYAESGYGPHGHGPRGYGRRFDNRRGYASFGAEWHPAFADTIRNMSEEEYGTFRQKLAEDRPTFPEAKTTIEIQ